MLPRSRPGWRSGHRWRRRRRRKPAHQVRHSGRSWCRFDRCSWRNHALCDVTRRRWSLRDWQRDVNREPAVATFALQRSQPQLGVRLLLTLCEASKDGDYNCEETCKLLCHLCMKWWQTMAKATADLKNGTGSQQAWSWTDIRSHTQQAHKICNIWSHF